MVRSVDAIRGRYGVTDYRWFDLRDSSSADPNIESQYGITRDDYSPKPAFATYRDLIARYSSVRGARVATSAECRRSPIAVVVPRWKSKRLTSLVVDVGGKVVKRVRRRTPRAVRISMRSGKAAVTLKLTAQEYGRRLTRVERRTYPSLLKHGPQAHGGLGTTGCAATTRPASQPTPAASANVVLGNPAHSTTYWVSAREGATP